MWFAFRLRSTRPRRLGLAAALSLAPLLAGCMTTHAASTETAEADRWEGTNRRIYQFNKNLDRAVLKPLANGYRTVVPTAARHGITNVYSNYGEPANLMNSVLQGKISQAFRTLDRFLINSTLGVGGLADNATDLGRPQEKEDFGQTFAAWGFDSGPYVVLPVFGPSTLRDSFGLAADIVIDPADFARNAAFSPSIYWRIGQLATRIINFRARLTDQGGDSLLADSLDEYALVRSVYLQSRRSALYDGNPPEDPEEELEEEAPEPATSAVPPPNPEAPAPQ
jgi:phospholipid-binding lipoprotein MlaA